MHSKPATFESVSILLDHHGQQPHETFAVSGESKTTNIGGEGNLFRPPESHRMLLRHLILLNGVFWCFPLSLKGIFGGTKRFACCLLNEQTDRPVS